jgi:predicted NACHT family NTPase
LREALGGAVATGERSVAVQGDANGATITTGNGNIILNITLQADGVQIDDRRYQGAGAEALRAVIQEILRPTLEIDWQQVSRSFLGEQLRLTTNPLTAGEGISYRTEQVYVPLGLVERKRQTRRGEDVSPEQGSLLYEEVEVTQRFENEQFLEQVLQRGQSPKSQGKRIAIIGEPGAGKTTLLQQIAQWVSGYVEGAIAIWVSLADLRGHELEPYLLEQWLQATVRRLGQAKASDQVKDAFVTQFQQGRVWLLLDGVDEMQVSSGNPLAEIARQVRLGGLLAHARIVLTCRLNLWDGDRHVLDKFDVYRTLEFAYPGQVEQFVRQWFGALPEAQTGQAERLCEALRQPGKERLRDLVKNPLRLTLLCFNWYLREGTLPETKAGLYEQFVADFYEWKREQFPTTAAQRGRLNAVLGELAREAIDKEETRFRLRHDFVCRYLGEPDEPDSLFQMALQLGWLNQIGVDAENRRKAIYAFFHPTFQEYFAASKIEDRHYFLNHIPENPAHPEAIYRIFQSHWREVFLLWIGQESSSFDNQDKEKMIDALINFDDQCEGFYEYQAYFLAALGLAEIKEYNSQKVVETLLKWSGKLETIRYFEPISQAAEETLRSLRFTKIKTNSSEVLKENTQYLYAQACERAIDEYEFDFYRRAEAKKQRTDKYTTNSKKKILQNEETETNQANGLDKIRFSIASLKRSTDGDSKRQAIYDLKKYGPGDLDSVNALIDCISTTEDKYTLWKIIESLGAMAINSIDVINIVIIP